MAQSREQLTMDMGKSDNSIFKRQRGCYLSQTRAISLIALFVVALVAVGFITHYATKSEYPSDALMSPGVEPNGKPGGEGTSTTAKVKDVRLPENVIPMYYKVELIPYVGQYEEKNFTIDGKVWIDLKCLQPTSKITLHLKNITVLQEKVKVYEIEEAETPVKQGEEEGKKNFVAEKHEYDIPREFYNVSLNGELETGKIYRIYIEFTALLADSLGGFYRSNYKEKGTNRTM
jgi:hypothetical protein